MILFLFGIVVLLYLINQFPYYSDYFYQDRSGYQCYPVRGGYSSIGARCGAFYVYAYFVASSAYWYIGAALVYQNRSNPNPKFSIRGGNSTAGSDCGALFINASDRDRYDGWYFGAALGLSKSKWFKLFCSWWLF